MRNKLFLYCVFILFNSSAWAQPQPRAEPWTWEQVRQRFQDNNPTLLAGKLNVDESKAQEITAYLRPNPSFSLLQDQINPFGGCSSCGTFSNLLS